jgi:hypothetical protein
LNFKKIFITQNYDCQGIIALNVWIRGIPTTLTIDDYIPFKSNTAVPSLLFAYPGYDGSLWAPLLEKAWAKVNGNYENINGGYPSETFRFLTNVPAYYYSVSSLTPATLWSLASGAVQTDFIMGATTAGGVDTEANVLNMPLGHAYSFLDARQVTAVNGTTYKLY